VCANFVLCCVVCVGVCALVALKLRGGMPRDLQGVWQTLRVLSGRVFWCYIHLWHLCVAHWQLHHKCWLYGPPPLFPGRQRAELTCSSVLS
jgi:hypothetical protein